MNSTCLDHALRIFACEGEIDAFDAEQRAHVAACTGCAAVVRRTARRVEALRALERLPVPAELAGHVVAAGHAGYREARAARALSALRREIVPRQLEQKVLEQPGLSASPRPAAPRVLERLIAEDLQDPAQVAARRAASRLERLRTPASLLARVESAIAYGRVSRRTWPLLWTALATGIVMLAGLGFLFVRERAGTSRSSAPRYRFEVEYATTLDGFDPIARSLLASVTGGLTALPPRVIEEHR